jgi:hypothetical protein
MNLFADPECWEFKKRHPKDFESFGCGPGGLGDLLVPDTVYFLSIRPACRIHDWYYRFFPGNSEDDRKRADRIFLNNMLRIVDFHTNFKVLRWLRKRRCNKYYFAVRAFGGPSFWADRNDV